jgi:tRNA-binding protein
MITWNDFVKIDMRSGTITAAKVFEKARKPAFQLWIDFGPLGIKKSSAQITDVYELDELIGKQVIAVINFPSKQIADFMSECLVMGIYGEDNKVTLVTPDKTVKNGQKIG